MNQLSNRQLLTAYSSKTTMLVSLRYLHPVLLENTMVAIFPKELASCHYTSLQQTRSLGSSLRTEVALFSPVDLHFGTHKGTGITGKAQEPRGSCSSALLLFTEWAAKAEKYRGSQQQFLPLYIPRRSFLGSLHMPKIQKLSPTDLKLK